MRGAWRGAILTPLVASVAQAQTTIDVAKISCKQFVLLKVGVPPGYLAIWLSGDYHGRRSDTLIDVQKLKDDAQKIRGYCLHNKGNPDAGRQEGFISRPIIFFPNSRPDRTLINILLLRGFLPLAMHRRHISRDQIALAI
jgi:hypothetical protein